MMMEEIFTLVETCFDKAGTQPLSTPSRSSSKRSNVAPTLTAFALGSCGNLR